MPADCLDLCHQSRVIFISLKSSADNLVSCLHSDSTILQRWKNGRNRREFKERYCLPIDCWNDVWHKLHQQIVNVDVFNVDTVPAEVYSTVATTVIWSMRLALSIGLYLWIDSMMRPIYAKLIPSDLGSPSKTTMQPLKRRALGSLGKSR